MTPAVAARLLAAALLVTACGPTGGNAASPAVAETHAATVSASPPADPDATPSGPAIASGQADTRTREHATIVTELRRQLVGHGATLDGAPVTDVAPVDACRTRFVTTKGETVVEWAKAGNIAPRDEAGREINDLPAADRPHPLSMPLGEAADGVSGALGLLAGECTG